MSPLDAGSAPVSPLTDATVVPVIEITDVALEQLIELRNEEPDAETLALRVAVASRPGEDFRYDLGFDEIADAVDTDVVRTAGDLTVIVPGDDVELLQGAVLDHTENQGLVIRNPNRPKAPSIEGLISDDAISAEVEAMVATEVNPALAAHGGFVTYVGHDGDGTAYLTMGGGCHGCSMSKMTMLEGVQTMLSEAVEAIERVRDLTDHSTGENPYYS